jgi:phosphoglycerate dehydrogenase-like enzyme
MKILIASSLDTDALDRLEQEHQVVRAYQDVPEGQLRNMIRDCDVLVFRSGVKVSAELMACAPNLKLIIRAGSGVDNIDLEYVQRRGLEFVRMPQPSARAVAEMTFAFMLALSRRLLEADGSMREGRWAKEDLSGYLLYGKTLGIVGVGNIGGCVADMGIAWGMNVIGCIEHPTPGRVQTFREQGIVITDFDPVVAEADYLSIHVPLKENTRRLFHSGVLARMKAGSYLLNLGRGGIVDEQALYAALTEGGRLQGAALDVHEQEGAGVPRPLADLPNVILTPHIGAMAIDTQREIGRRVVETVNSFPADKVTSSCAGLQGQAQCA